MIPLQQLKAMTAVVPCNGCTECCRRQTVTACEEFGDDIDFLRNHADPVLRGDIVAYKLHQKPNGDCVFLDRATGCTIYDRRPVLCRTYDCVDDMRRWGASRLPGGIRKAARRLLKAGYRPPIEAK